MDLESQKGIRHGLQDSRRIGLSQFVDELMPILVSEGYTLEDFLHALANWTADKPHLIEVLGHLENATQSVSRVMGG